MTQPDEVSHLRSQNDQLWKIIEKQRILIQNLQKDNVRLSTESDGLQDHLHTLEVRKQEMISAQEQEDVASTINSEISSPMLPPRSPYRAAKEDYPSLNTVVLSQEPEYLRSNTIDDLNGRSSPTTKHRKAKSLASSKSSSSLETRKHSHRFGHGSSTRSSSPTTFHSSTTHNKQHPYLVNMANIDIKVIGSNIKPNEKGKEVVSFIISVGSLGDDQFDEHWRVEKLYSDFLNLSAKLKAHRNKEIEIGKLPDKSLFSNNAPTIVEQRKIALEQYLQHVISLPLKDTSDLCEFLGTNVIDTKAHQVSTGQKEGYLTKRGKNFGGWKTRYFVLNKSLLEYYDSKEGIPLGSIRLSNAQIGTQNASNDDANSDYRHAFLIVEQKRAGFAQSTQHILCASSDDDRDSWVHALLQQIRAMEGKRSHQH